MTSGSPTTIGPYTIDRELGRGGMGVVYLARDTRLDRPVAIKALPEHLATDPDRLARFEREARTLASLSHPNIAGIFGLEEHAGARYLVLEYVEGETLVEILDRGPLPVDEAIEIAVQIAAGVEAAHEAGVIHRDLKPGNIIITPEGKAKVLDFGLARVEETSSSSSAGGMSNSPTLTSPAIQHSPTMPGAILGTAAYMSPEQARGRKVDKRTDIWSFGVVLYEMLTGASPFRGETVSDSIGAVLHKNLDLDRLPPTTPENIRRVLGRCLERDKNRRLRDIGDAGIELDRVDLPQTHAHSADARSRRGIHPAIVALSAILFALVGAGVVVLTRPAPPAPPVIRATIPPPDDAIIVYIGDLAGPATISRDGKRITFAAKRAGQQQQLYLRALDSDQAEPVPGSTGAIFPFWSWDGSQIAYFTSGELRVYDIPTRTNRTLCPAPGGRGGAWLKDGSIVFTPGFQSPIYRVPSTGGDPIPITSINTERHTSHRWPSVTADGTNFIYIAVSHEPGMIDESALYLATPPDRPDIEITRARYGAEIVGDQLLIMRDRTLTATPFDASTGTLTGSAAPVLMNVASDLSTWNAPFSASATGVIVFHERDDTTPNGERPGSAVSLGESQRSLLIGREGRVSSIIADGVPQNTLALSPDSRYLAISGKPEDTNPRNSFDIWLYQMPTGLFDAPTVSDATISGASSAESQARLSEPPRRLTFLDSAEISPQWSPDGQWLAFGNIARQGTTSNMIYKVRLSGGSPVPLLESPSGFDSAVWPTDWTADGRYIIYVKGSWVFAGNNDLYALDLETNESIPLVIQDGDQYFGEVSPDGRWLLYNSNESGTGEVYVVPFPPGWDDDRANGNPTPPDDARWRVSIAGGGAARWSPKGDELFYIARSNSMIAVPVRTEGADFIHSAGSAIFQTRFEPSVDFDVSANARGFAINASVEESRTAISLITNWQTMLKK